MQSKVIPAIWTGQIRLYLLIVFLGEMLFVRPLASKHLMTMAAGKFLLHVKLLMLLQLKDTCESFVANWTKKIEGFRKFVLVLCIILRRSFGTVDIGFKLLSQVTSVVFLLGNFIGL